MTRRRKFTVRFATRAVTFEVSSHVCHNRDKLAKLVKRGEVLRVLVLVPGPERQAHLNLGRVEEIL